MTSVNLLLHPSGKEGCSPDSLSMWAVHRSKPRTVTRGLRVYPQEWGAGQQRIIYPINDSKCIPCIKDMWGKMNVGIPVIFNTIALHDKQGRYSNFVKKRLAKFQANSDVDVKRAVDGRVGYLTTKDE